jgi:hypothetical protein
MRKLSLLLTTVFLQLLQQLDNSVRNNILLFPRKY